MPVRAWSRDDIAEALFAPPLERMIGVARFIFAGFALISIYLDPTLSTSDPGWTYAILYVYFFYAGVLAALSLSLRLSKKIEYVQHAIDLIAFSLILHFTEGPSSPYFVLFTF